jgi:hypothetical protein
LHQFKKEFSHSNQNGGVPLILNHSVSILACDDTLSAWQFYLGSYKAYLEEYSTLTHFEHALAKSMKNPLTSIIKLGIIG